MEKIDEIIKKAILNDMKIALEDINISEMTEQDYDLLISALKQKGIEIVEKEEKSEKSGYISDDLRAYLNNISIYPLLTKEEEIELFKKYKAGDKSSKQKLINSNLKLVVSISSKFYRVNKNSSFALLDIIQEGNIGLIKAIEKFDYTKGYKLSTYATWWIKQSIQRFSMESSKTIRIPVHSFERINKIRMYEVEYFKLNGIEPTLQNCSDDLGYSIEDIKILRHMNQELVSLDASVGEEKETPLLNLISDQENIEQAIVDKLYYNEIKERLSRILTEKELLVVSLRFGLDDGNSHTLEEVGQILNVTRERVRQIESKALLRARKILITEKTSKKPNVYIKNSHKLK